MFSSTPDSRNTEPQFSEIYEASRTLRLTCHVLDAKSPPDLDLALTGFARAGKWGHRQHRPVLHYCTNHIVALAANHAIPAIYGRREFAAVGGLISYGESLAEAYRQMGLYAAKILKGARTTNLPVMQLAMVELVINNRTAKALGLPAPPGTRPRRRGDRIELNFAAMRYARGPACPPH